METNSYQGGAPENKRSVLLSSYDTEDDALDQWLYMFSLPFGIPQSPTARPNSDIGGGSAKDIEEHWNQPF